MKRIRTDYINLSKINLSDVICELLEDWAGRVANQATLPKLIKILKQGGIPGCAGKIIICRTEQFYFFKYLLHYF